MPKHPSLSRVPDSKSTYVTNISIKRRKRKRGEKRWPKGAGPFRSLCWIENFPTSITDSHISVGMEDPTLENASPSMVKQRVWSSHRLPNLGILLSAAAAYLWLPLGREKYNSPWKHTMWQHRNFTNSLFSSTDDILRFAAVRHLERSKLNMTIEIHCTESNNWKAQHTNLQFLLLNDCHVNHRQEHKDYSSQLNR